MEQEMKFIGKGAHSSVYIDPTNPNVIIKQNNNVAGNPRYLKRQQIGYETIERIKKSGYPIGVLLPTLIEMSDSNNVQTIKEQRINGQPFDMNSRMWDSLTETQKNSVAKQMATFLVAMHSADDIAPADKSIKAMYEKSNLHSATDIINAYEGAMPKTLASRLIKAEEYLNNADISDEIHVLTHKDLRANNLMYDPKTSQMAVIDFELASHDNVYRDFIAFAPASSMPWDYTKRVISEYNSTKNKKYPIKINPEKVQNMLLYAIMHEHSRNITPEQNKTIPETEKQKFFERLLYRLNELTGLDIASNTAEAFKKGNSNLKNTLNATQAQTAKDR